MKLLFDANMSYRLVHMLEDIFPGSTHVTIAGLSGETPDEIIWHQNDFTILTADGDFVNLSNRSRCSS